jgi:hypothetical protein
MNQKLSRDDIEVMKDGDVNGDVRKNISKILLLKSTNMNIFLRKSSKS